jgi:MFS family permease
MKNLTEIRRVLGHREFRMLWLAQSSSVIGDSIVLVALALFVVGLTGSASDLGLVLAAHALSLVAFLLLGGVWADRLPRHRVMIVTDFVRFALHALLAVLIFTAGVEIWEVVAIEVVFGAAEAFSRPAANGLLPRTVPEADIQQATAITTMSSNVSEFAGPALATVLVLGAGAGWAFALDAATFLVSAAFLSRVRPRERATWAPTSETSAARVAASADAGGAVSVLEGIRAGAREVRARVWVWATLASFCVALFCGVAPWFVLGPLVAREQYGDIAVYGVVEAALGFGTIIGSLAGVAWRPRFPLRRAMLAMLVWPLAAGLYAAGVTLTLVIPAMVLGGVGFALFDVWWLTALAERIPPQALSRVSSYDWMVSFALLPLGFVLAGPLAARLGAVNVLLGGSALAFLAFALGLLPHETRMLERERAVEPAVLVDDPARGLTHRY